MRPLATLLDTDPVIRQELVQRLQAGINLLDAERLGVPLRVMRTSVMPGAPSDPLAERLAVSFARPAVPFGASLAEVESRQWNRRLTIARREITRATNAVARVWLDDHPALQWAGTCWFATDTIAVTTRAVAEECRAYGAKARLERGGQTFRVVGVQIPNEAGLASLMAFLIVESTHTLTDPWRFSGSPAAAQAHVATIAYCARDSRAGDALIDEVYARSFNQKCVAPGCLLTAAADSPLTHDCASVGNSGGGVIVDLGTGNIVGLHVAGALNGPAIGVPLATVERALRAIVERVEIALPHVDEDALERTRPTAEDYADREGYRADFLGVDVPLPVSQGASDDALLAYTNFSVCMSKERRMCRFTACNVEGGNLKDLSRSGIPWRFDPRLEEEVQAGNELYIDNEFDRGHMVRRLDPVWGDSAEAANEDTFHYTNSCPQHKDLNQKTWNDLEDYVLQNAGKHRLDVSVFTGPVFRSDDPEYRDFQVPVDFWKVVVMVKDDGTLSATAYTLSQRDLVTGLEFLFGEFRTYQVPIRQIEEWTQLDFGALRDFDPKEALEAATAPVEIQGPADIQL